MGNANLQKRYDLMGKLSAQFAGFHHVAGTDFHAFASLHSDPMEMIPVAVCPSPTGVYGSCDIIGCIGGEYTRIPKKDCDIIVPSLFDWSAQQYAQTALRFGITFGGRPAVKAA